MAPPATRALAAALIALLACSTATAFPSGRLLPPRRQLKQNIAQNQQFSAGTTPSFKSSSTMAPASTSSSTNVVSTRPSVQTENKVPGTVVERTGSTEVKTTEPATFSDTTNEDGRVTSFNSGKRVFSVARTSGTAVNFPSTSVAAGGGTPLQVTQANQVVGPAPNRAVSFKSGSGPTYASTYKAAFGPGNGR